MSTRASVNVSITPRLQEFVQHLVSSGRYRSVSEVFREGLRLLEQAERRRLVEKWLAEGLTPHEQAKLPTDRLDKIRLELNAKIQEGLDALARGEAVDGNRWFANWESRLNATPRPVVGRRPRVKSAG